MIQEHNRQSVRSVKGVIHLQAREFLAKAQTSSPLLCGIVDGLVQKVKQGINGQCAIFDTSTSPESPEKQRMIMKNETQRSIAGTDRIQRLKREVKFGLGKFISSDTKGTRIQK